MCLAVILIFLSIHDIDNESLVVWHAVLCRVALYSSAYWHQGVLLQMTFFYLFASQQIIRENAIAALRACLALMAQRETKETQRPTWYSVS